MKKLSVIFDMDGVILDTETTVTKCWIAAAIQLGMDVEAVKQASLDVIGKNQASIIELYDSRFSSVEGYSFDKLFKIERTFFEAEARRGIPVKEGARELLQWLKDQNATVGLASSSALKNVTEELEAVGLLDYFQELICGDMVSNGKPDPEIYLKCASKLGVEPSDTFVFEDSYNGIKSAHTAGMRTIMVPDCLPPTEETDKMVIATIKSLSVAKEFIISHSI